jgi:transglutaminase-like putative cysteine protease
MQTLLGSQFNTDIKIQSYEDADTGRCNYFKMAVKQGEIKRNSKVEVKDNVAVITPLTGGDPIKIELTPGILFGDGELFRHVEKDFASGNTTEKNYKVLDAQEGKVLDMLFTKLGVETVKTAGKTVEAVVFNQHVKATGMKVKLWYDLEKHEMVKLQVLNRELFKTDHRVVDKIKVANMDESIFTRSNVSIADIQAISYMKVKARLEPTGVQLSPEDLNVPGQRFTGTVKDNVVEGIFEIEHMRYTGENAPPFPADYSSQNQLKKYLEQGPLIESNDPVLIKKAQEITRGAADSWEAACRLSQWVAENISYAIPGGGTARKAYDIRAGECGAHSFLTAAFCRAVGIPARVVWGAMYSPNFGGGFGQHAWNEIYMGDAGWITIDSTAFETDFVDSGHIRVSEYQSIATSLNGKKFEVLDYKPGTTLTSKTETTPNPLKKYMGKYVGPDKQEFNVKTENDTLVVRIPGNVSLPFDEPGEDGRRYCKLAKHIYIVFQEDDSGNVTEIDFHQILTLHKKSPPDSLAGIPDAFKQYVGNYILRAANVNTTVFYDDGNLALVPPEGGTVKLLKTDKKDVFKDRDKKEYFFERDDKGTVTGMKVTTLHKLKPKR